VQNAAFVSAVHVQTLLLQVCGDVQLPQLVLILQIVLVPQLYPKLEQVTVQGAAHKLVLKVHRFVHFNVPVYPAPKTPSHVAPPKAELSHFSVPSIIPFPQTGVYTQSLSFATVHPTGQYPSLFIQAVIFVYSHLLFKQVSVVLESLSLH
jgi:hypothetical protein